VSGLRGGITIEETAYMASGSSTTVMLCGAQTNALCATAAPISAQEWTTSFLETRGDRP